jgi:cellulose synthase/poly-beta-1,6-N-acetylglucosamine synthase-like glycosyltransferase
MSQLMSQLISQLPFINQSVLLLLNAGLMAIALSLLLPTAVLFIECSVAVLFTRCKTTNPLFPTPKITVLIPAHNEELGIGKTLETIKPQLAESDQLVVVADNCTDQTAAIARSFGAIVVERQDSDRKGKGYALDYGLQLIEKNPPEVVVLVDADCLVEPDAIARIARLAVLTSRPVQSIYLMAQPQQPQPKDSLSALAFLVKNLVRPTGLDRLGLPCLLTGTGMAFPWAVIRSVSLASGNIVEDMQLSFDLAVAGYPARFCPEAQVIGQLPQQEQIAKGQRTRWEHGHLQTLLTQVPRLLRAAIAQQRWDLVAIALDLCVPPLSLLVILWVVALSGALLSFWLGASSIPVVLLAGQGLMILLSIVGAWAKFGRNDISGFTLLSTPFYILWKIPLYIGFWLKPQTQWVRTERESIDTPKPE